MPTDHAEVAVMPPFLFLGALALGCASEPRRSDRAGAGIGERACTRRRPDVRSRRLCPCRPFGPQFPRAGTSVVPAEPATALVVTGPYRFTRNPIYIGFVLAYFGFAIVLTSMWVLLLLIPVLVILQRGVVAREEEYLERQFGEAYRKYKARVPRWL